MFRLPWKTYNAPHAVLDILRGCNVVCKSCYNTDEIRIRPYEEIVKEIEILTQKRKLDSIAIIGGEPLLHPDLEKILEWFQRKGIHTEIFTNGLLLTPERLKRFKELGVTIVFIHIERGQKRSDLIDSESIEAVDALRSKIATMINQAGIDCGISQTYYEGNQKDLEHLVRWSIDHKDVN